MQKCVLLTNGTEDNGIGARDVPLCVIRLFWASLADCF